MTDTMNMTAEQGMHVEEAVIEQADMNEWFALTQQLKPMKKREMELRKKIFNIAFPDPREGSNTFDLAGGFKLRGSYKLTRTIDEGALQAILPQLTEAGISSDAIVKHKVSLVLKEYTRLETDQRLLFDQCLVTKPGSPALEVIPPKVKEE